jgi:cytochrome c-type biogenesis protein
MSEWVQAFALGNAAILGNVCLLPLYPGLFVLLANRRADGRPAPRWLGAVVLAGVITLMVALGFVLYSVQRSVADILDWLLPTMYLAVIALGIAMLAGRNPFERLSMTQAPIVRSPAGTAFLYGMFLAPMTLPCTGPLIISAFVIGGVAGTGALTDSLTYVVAFALGFGWPLVLLPLVAAPVQKRATRFLTSHHRTIGAFSGLLLIAVAAIGLWQDVLPSVA